MTRDETCLTRQDGQPCEFRTTIGGARACARLTCCSNPDLPSPADYERRLAHPAATCPHPAGDQWAGCTVEPMPVGATTTTADPRVVMLTVRARCCKDGGSVMPHNEFIGPCGAHFTGPDAPWGCAELGSKDIRERIKDPAFGCPRGCFEAVVSG